ncbi:MAG: hypothetical protein ACJAWV_002528 [Flammeovirgaceae bacterium]
MPIQEKRPEMKLQQRIAAFNQLHQKLKNLDEATLDHWKRLAESGNSWFKPADTQLAIDGLISYLEPSSFAKWLSNYDISDSLEPKKIGIIMAGNIPLVGVHDFACVLASGHILHAKPSSQDAALIKKVAELLIEIEPEFSKQIQFVERMNDVDVLIATGSDNSARYFEYYFRDKPKIIRKNRTSIAVLDGTESKDDLKRIENDIFAYYGLGCRNVSKVFVPKNYDFIPLLFSLEEKGNKVAENHKYNNNYDYNKSIYLVNRVKHLDNGSLLLTESEQLVSPISVLYFEEYESEEGLKTRLSELKDKIQCIVSNGGNFPNSLSFGQAQFPQMTDYADGVDTMQFLLEA